MLYRNRTREFSILPTVCYCTEIKGTPKDKYDKRLTPLIRNIQVDWRL